jgi:hypothetical protein
MLAQRHVVRNLPTRPRGSKIRILVMMRRKDHTRKHETQRVADYQSQVAVDEHVTYRHTFLGITRKSPGCLAEPEPEKMT